MPSKTGGGVLFQDVTESELVTANTGSKTGEACSTNVLGLVSLGDSSAEAAKKNGRISRVASVDAKLSSILGLFGKRCTIVKGQ
ncbi:MAG: TRL-like family protein [Alphaproteobacteria bacterium]